MKYVLHAPAVAAGAGLVAMPQAPLFELIQERAGTLPPSQRTLARHVVGNYQAVAFSTIAELARQAGVSEATVVRFAAALGFDGYPALQKEIRRIVRADLKGTERFRLTAQAAAGNGPLRTVVRKELENIAHLESIVDARALRAAAARLRRAREVVVAGARSSAGLATHLWFALDKLRFPVRLLRATGAEAMERVGRLDSSGCLVVIGFPRYLRGLVELLAFARARGVPTIVVTDSPFSVLKGDIGLYAPAESASFVAFHCAPLILLNALIEEAVRADQPRTLAALKQFEALADSAGYFHPA